ncbi:unnamed protein product [Cochlearia groenlandica]
MEDLSSIWIYQESMDELRQKLQYNTFELEAMKSKSNEESKIHQEEIKNLLHLLKIARQERDEAKDQLQRLITIKTNSAITESISNGSSPVNSFFEPVSSPEFSNFKNRPVKYDPVESLMDEIIKGKSLPEKGKLLQAMKESGPLLQTLLLAGELPRWRNPPPLQQSFRVPAISSSYDILKGCSTKTSILSFKGCSVPGIEITKRQRFY